MCGIAGWLRSSPAALGDDSTQLMAMIQRIAHRGPDGLTTHQDGLLALAHARLAVVDIAGGQQPMFNETGELALVCNGEIFNHRSLRQRLQARGHRFGSLCDVEVILHLYEEMGLDFVHELNGQFALALWDGPRQRLVLARDHVGMRPLHYTVTPQRLAFASEAKALLALPELAAHLNAAALSDVFSLWAPRAGSTLFQGIESLPPGHLGIWQQQRLTLQRWWDWSLDTAPPASLAQQDALADELEALLRDAVALQLQADVPVAAYLSGGLDSSLLVTLAAQAQPGTLNTYGLNFDHAEWDERPHQRALADGLGARHHGVHCREADIAAGLAATVWHAETPLVRTAPVPMRLLAQQVQSQGDKVVLSGEGADEAFAGYDLFKFHAAMRFAASAPGSVSRKALLGRVAGKGAALAWGGKAAAGSVASAVLAAHQPRLRASRRFQRLWSPDLLQACAGPDAQEALIATLPARWHQAHPLTQAQYVEAHTLLSGQLLSTQGDRMAMAHGVEVRMPYLDPRILAFASRLPPSLKLRGLQDKLLLRRVAARVLPPAFASRPKQAYRAPETACFFSDGQPLPWVAELLAPDALQQLGWFEPKAVALLLARCQRGVSAGVALGDADHIAFVGLISTLLWQQAFQVGAP
jgi:asparagine synthase (glutamine-hydrolysing)